MGNVWSGISDEEVLVRGLECHVRSFRGGKEGVGFWGLRLVFWRIVLDSGFHRRNAVIDLGYNDR